MRRLGTLFIGILIGGAVVWGGLSYHLVHAEDGFHRVPKTKSTMSDIYVDIREFGPKDWMDHPDLAAALIQENKGMLIQQTSADQILKGFDDLIPNKPK